MMQDPPNSIKIELTQGCNLKCPFCPISTGIYKGFEFMSIETAEVLSDGIKEAGWNSRIDYSMRGEPTLNPNWKKITKILRDNLERNSILMLTNGAGLMYGKGPVENIKDGFGSGLSVIGIERYQNSKIWKRILNEIEGKFTVEFYPESGAEANPHRRYPWGENKVVFIEDISVATSGTHNTIANMAGAVGEKVKEPIKERCVRPFREFIVYHNGKVPICCLQWKEVLIMGNIRKESMVDIWNSDKFDEVRRRLYWEDRNFPPCDVCDSPGGYRKGLLPDRMGKRSMKRLGEE